MLSNIERFCYLCRYIFVFFRCFTFTELAKYKCALIVFGEFLFLDERFPWDNIFHLFMQWSFYGPFDFCISNIFSGQLYLMNKCYKQVEQGGAKMMDYNSEVQKPISKCQLYTATIARTQK